MPAHSDQLRRDAEHAARAEIGLFLEKFKRRMYEHAKAHIAEELASASSGVVDGTELGRTAASRGIEAFISDEPADAIDGGSAALEAPASS